MTPVFAGNDLGDAVEELEGYHRHGLASKVYLHLLTSTMGLAQHEIQLAAPLAVALTERAVPEAIWVWVLVLQPRQLRGYALTSWPAMPRGNAIKTFEDSLLALLEHEIVPRGDN